MSPFEHFAEFNGPAIGCAKASDTALNTYTGRLPEALIEHWLESGWCGYARGLIWIVNPLDYETVAGRWLDASVVHSPVIFGRTAFADLFVWSDQGVSVLNVHYKRLTVMADDIEGFFEYGLCRRKYLKHGLLGDLFTTALPVLGPPNSDECYAFVPALALGGPGTVESLRKVKALQHLDLLLQLE